MDELHARRLATVASIIESALGRMEVLFRSLEISGSHDALETPPAAATSSGISRLQMQQARGQVEGIRRRLREVLDRFGVSPCKPEPRQVLAAELSTLWVVLENARPARMKGYGRKFEPADKADWERFVEGMLHDLEQFRRLTAP